MKRRPGDDLVVLTQNVWGHAPRWERRRALLVNRMAVLRPDIVGMQEVHADDARTGCTQAHEVAEALGGYDVFFAPGRARDRGPSEGIALLCRRDHVREHSTESLTLDPSDPLEGKNQRVVLCGMLYLAEGPIDVFVTHLSLSRAARRRTVTELLDFVGRERARSGSFGALLLGDFNASPDEPTVELLVRGGAAPDRQWADAWTRANGARRGGTWPALVGLWRLDYVLLQPPDTWTVRSCERVPYSGSDHMGVLARLGIRD